MLTGMQSKIPHRHNVFFKKHPSLWTIESFTQHVLIEKGIPAQISVDWVHRNWVQMLRRISQCQLSCTFSLKDRAALLLEEALNVLSIYPFRLLFFFWWWQYQPQGRFFNVFSNMISIAL